MPQHLTVLLFSAALLAGSGDGAAETAPDAEDATPAAPIAEPPVAFIEPASVSSNPGTGVLPTRHGWLAYLETLAPEQRRVLNAFNSRHFLVLIFHNEADRKKLEELGFPTREDVLEAARLTDSELKARADTGDVQAHMLLVDRLTNQAEALYATRDTNPEAYERASARAFVELAIFSARLKKSPFGAYLEGRLNWKLRSGQPAEMMAASLMVAWNMGDWRAKTWLIEFQRKNPQLDAAQTVIIYDILRRSWKVQ